MWSCKDDPRLPEDSPGLAPTPIVPKPPALPPGVEVGEFFSGAQTPVIWLSVPWFSLRTLDFKVLRNHVTSVS